MELKSRYFKPFRIPDDPDLDDAVWSANHGDENLLCLKCRKYLLTLFYASEEQVVAGCPNCLLLSLSRIRGRREGLPREIAHLEEEALKELDAQNKNKLHHLDASPEET